MSNPAVIIVAGIVIAAAAVLAFFATSSRPQAQTYGRRGGTKRRPSPPPSPPRQRRSPVRRRRRSPDRNSYPPCQDSTWGWIQLRCQDSTRESAVSQTNTCTNCGQSSFVKIHPCNHESLCRGCFLEYLETNDTCNVCSGRIDSCSPSIPLYEKCSSCRKFTKLIKFLPCNHSLSLCINCFERQNRSYKRCPECQKPIRNYEPNYSTSGLCIVCGEFMHFAKFYPCDHGSFCMEHAREFFESEQQCNVCGERVTEVL